MNQSIIMYHCVRFVVNNDETQYLSCAIPFDNDLEIKGFYSLSDELVQNLLPNNSSIL